MGSVYINKTIMEKREIGKYVTDKYVEICEKTFDYCFEGKIWEYLTYLKESKKEIEEKFREVEETDDEIIMRGFKVLMRCIDLLQNGIEKELELIVRKGIENEISEIKNLCKEAEKMKDKELEEKIKIKKI